MIFSVQQAARALILLAFSVLILKMHFSGDITKFINPKYENLSMTAAILFMGLFMIQITRIWTTKAKSHHNCSHDDHHCGHDHGDSTFTSKKLLSYLVIIFPLVTGFVLPAKVLDASIADKKGAMLMLAKKNQTKTPTENVGDNSPSDTKPEDSQVSDDNLDTNPPLEGAAEISQDELDKLLQQLEQSQAIDLNDYVFSTYYEEISSDITKYKGKTIKLTGSVYKEEGLPENQLVISRFLITHCVADASIVGFLSEFEDAASLSQDTWIEAEGVLDIGLYGGIELPMIKITKWKKTNEPKEPYLYPINVKIL